jgi:hypothetical protein
MVAEKSSLAGEGAHLEVFLDVIEVKTFFSCGTKLRPARHQPVGQRIGDVLAPEADRAAVTLSSPKSALSVVDLPAPFGPTMTPMSDCSMAMLTPLRIGAPP